MKEDKELYPSAIFNNDETYETHIRNTIAMLETCILNDEDVVIEGPMATRVLLDFYEETLRRFFIYNGKRSEK